mgnify:CR=1 FL=1|tara:strand:+ start:277 stop:495 length:219 start_codon:yes stop_codon:yes gene_type:complete
MSSATRIIEDQGEGEINGTPVSEKRAVPNMKQGSANDLAFDAEKADRNKDGKVDSYERTVATRMLENMRKNA